MCILQVKAVVLDPANEFNVDRTLTKEDVQKLIKVKTAMPHYRSIYRKVFTDNFGSFISIMAMTIN